MRSHLRRPCHCHPDPSRPMYRFCSKRKRHCLCRWVLLHCSCCPANCFVRCCFCRYWYYFDFPDCSGKVQHYGETDCSLDWNSRSRWNYCHFAENLRILHSNFLIQSCYYSAENLRNRCHSNIATAEDNPRHRELHIRNHRFGKQNSKDPLVHRGEHKSLSMHWTENLRKRNGLGLNSRQHWSLRHVPSCWRERNCLPVRCYCFAQQNCSPEHCSFLHRMKLRSTKWYRH